jgi:translation elongation factor EF-1beta
LNENIIGANRSFIKRIEINWDTYQKNVSILLDDKLKEEKHFRKEVPFGLNYLRIGIPGASPDRAGYYIKSVKVVPQN